MISDMLNILPRELILKIYDYLSNQELCSLRQTSRLFQDSTLFSFLARLKSEAVVDITVQSTYAFFLKKNGTVWVYGRNNFGQLGIKDLTSEPILFKQVPHLPKIKKIVSELAHTFFLTQKGEVYACGLLHNTTAYGRGWLGIGKLCFFETFISSPRLVSLPKPVKDIVISNFTSFFLIEDDSVFACGNNQSHQLGIGDAPFYITPTETSLRNVKKIVATDFNTFFILHDGSVKVCGQNNNSCLGVGHALPQLEPIQLKGLPPIINVITHDDNTFFISESGKAFFSGRNLNGQGGVGHHLPCITPTAVSLPSKVIEIILYYHHSLFLLDDNQVYMSGQRKYERNVIANPESFIHPTRVNFGIKHMVAKNGIDALFVENGAKILNCDRDGSKVQLMSTGAKVEEIELPYKIKHIFGLPSYYRTFYLLENNTVYFNGSPLDKLEFRFDSNYITVPKGINEFNRSQILLHQIEEALENDKREAYASVRFANE